MSENSNVGASQAFRSRAGLEPLEPGVEAPNTLDVENGEVEDTPSVADLTIPEIKEKIAEGELDAHAAAVAESESDHPRAGVLALDVEPESTGTESISGSTDS